MLAKSILATIRRSGALLAALASAIAFGPIASAADHLPASTAAPTFTVNSLLDVPADLADTDYSVCRTAANNSVCTLRAAVMKANRFAGGGATINIPAGTYNLIIAPAAPYDDRNGDFDITNTVTILGAGAGVTILDGGARDRLFLVKAGATVVIRDATIRNGLVFGSGGGIYNNGDLTLVRSTVSGNMASSLSYGGGIYSDGLLTLDTSQVESNRADSVQGGGIFVYSGTATINFSAISGNRSARTGGGIFISADAVVTLNNSTVNGNLVTEPGYQGGGIENGGTFTANNSTISANSAPGSGGGLRNVGTANLFNVTIAGNVADNRVAGGGWNGGGISTDVSYVTNLWNTLLAENFVGANNVLGNDCAGTITSEDYNYIQVTAGCNLVGTVTHNLSGGEAGLGALADFGGPTLTRALLPGSPALDQIPTDLDECRDSFGVSPSPDQRGVARPVNDLCDMGAFEGVYDPGLYFRNLVRNGDAESGGASPTGAYVGTPNWTVTSGTFTAAPYNISFFPSTVTQTVPADHGYNFFAGGPDSPTSDSSQVIDLTALAGDIDAGQVFYTLSADLGGDRNQADSAAVNAFFQDEALTPLDTASIGPVTRFDRGDLTGFMPVTFSGTVPAGTRSIVIEVIMQGAGYNNGYADNLSLVLRPDLNYLFLPFLAR